MKTKKTFQGTEMRHIEKGIPIAQHTPTPCPEEGCEKPCPTCEGNEDRELSATPRPWPENINLMELMERDNWMENHAVILRAVNCHEELVNALKQFVDDKTEWDADTLDLLADHFRLLIAIAEAH